MLGLNKKVNFDALTCAPGAPLSPGFPGLPLLPLERNIKEEVKTNKVYKWLKLMHRFSIL